MPIYEYEPDGEHCRHCGPRFEVLQGINDRSLTRCPECGNPCHRVFSSFAAGKSVGDKLSPKNLAGQGFTQYTRAGDGHYEKTAGPGPRVIKGD
jgi:putative FmdB family regulatory protein